jgi:hypothetical protein
VGGELETTPRDAADVVDPGPAERRPTVSFGGLRRAATNVGLPAWFIAIDILWLANPVVLGIDARHYQIATSLWLAGGDPWKSEGGYGFAAGPHTLLMYTPTSVLPLELSVAFWTLLGLAASIWLVRRMEVSMWWLLFPPLVHSIWNANPQTIALALLVLGGSSAAVIAVFFKLYAAVPLIAKPRTLVIVVIALVVTLPILPWQLYVEDGFGVSTHLANAWNGSAWRIPILIPPTLVALWILRRQGAEWLAVPAVWPATQFYYVAMAFPVAVRKPVVAAALALPLPLMTPVVVMLMAARHLWSRRGAESTAAGPVGD